MNNLRFTWTARVLVGYRKGNVDYPEYENEEHAGILLQCVTAYPDGVKAVMLLDNGTLELLDYEELTLCRSEDKP
jgi:hypothetical protein